jgi:hypothetical protein
MENDLWFNLQGKFKVKVFETIIKVIYAEINPEIEIVAEFMFH